MKQYGIFFFQLKAKTINNKSLKNNNKKIISTQPALTFLKLSATNSLKTQAYISSLIEMSVKSLILWLKF